MRIKAYFNIQPSKTTVVKLSSGYREIRGWRGGMPAGKACIFSLASAWKPLLKIDSNIIIVEAKRRAHASSVVALFADNRSFGGTAGWALLCQPGQWGKYSNQITSNISSASAKIIIKISKMGGFGQRSPGCWRCDDSNWRRRLVNGVGTKMSIVLAAAAVRSGKAAATITALKVRTYMPWLIAFAEEARVNVRPTGKSVCMSTIKVNDYLKVGLITRRYWWWPRRGSRRWHSRLCVMTIYKIVLLAWRNAEMKRRTRGW